MKPSPRTQTVESGVEWIGAVPSECTIQRMSWLFEAISSGTTPPSDDPTNYGGDTCWVTTGELREALITDTEKKVSPEALARFPALRVYPIDTVLIAMYGATIGRLAMLGIPACTNQACCALAFPKRVTPRFGYYALWAARDFLILQASGGGQPNINQETVRSLRVGVPPKAEQEAITTFLDHETARLDTLIAKQERLIELLQEKRHAVISHAVTKGLDPEAPMKDSGVEWLGQVPETWDTAPLRAFLRLRRDIVGRDSVNTKLLSLTLQGVIERDLENRTGKMPATFDGYQRISAGEMVFCLFDMDETPRTVGVAPEDGMLTGAYTVFQPRSEQWARFLYYFFLHVDDHKRLRPFYKGLRKTIRPSSFLSIQVPRPTDSAACEIVRYLDKTTTRIEALIAKAGRSIEMLRERRSVLISSTITGKIDVRRYADASR